MNVWQTSHAIPADRFASCWASASFTTDIQNFPKLFTLRGHTEFAGMLRDLAIPAAEPMAWLAGAVECAGGVALLAGLWTGVAAVLLIADMLVAAFQAHATAGFSSMKTMEQSAAGSVFGMPGYEVNLLYITALVSLLLSGPGGWSLYAWRRRKTSVDTQTVIRAEPRRVPLGVDRQNQ